MSTQNETITELIALLKESRQLGLTFDIGNVYIRRAYIDAQDDLRARIQDAIDRAQGDN